MRKLFISSLTMLFFIVSNHSQALDLGGTIATDSTLSLSNSPYVVTSSLTINQGVRLTIASGVILKFENGVSMNIYGRVNATNVTFTSNAASPSNGIWGNLSFGSSSNTDSSLFTGCTIQWASNLYIQNLYTVRLNGCTVSKFSGNPFYIIGGSAFLNNTGVANCNGNIYLQSGKLDCSNSTTIFSVGGTYYGAIDNYYGNLSLASTTIQSCAFPVKLDDQSAVLTISGTTDLSSNTQAAILVPFTYINASRTVTFPTANVPYIIQNGLNIESGSRLNIGDNNILKFNYYGITVHGTLYANASSGKNIYFTSYRDDNWGGDSNGDAGASAPGRGNWTAIKFFNSSVDANCIMRRVKVRYADKGIETEDASPTIDSSDFSINMYGLSMLNTSTPIVTNNTFGSAQYTPIALSFEADPVFNNNSFSFSDNQYDAIGLYGGTLTANARVKVRSVTSYPNVTYVMLSNITVPSDKTLTIDPGVVIKCISQGSSAFIVNGKMISEGTAALPIVVTSVRDDNYGQPQDTNKDGSSSSPSKGDFASFCFFQGSTGNSFKYCKIRYSNGYNSQTYEFSSAAFNFINANGTIQNCEIKDNENGINCFLASNLTIQDNDFANLSFAVTLSAAANPTLIGNTLTNVGYRALGLIGVGFYYDNELTVSGTIKQKNFAGYNNITYVLRNHLYIANGTNISVDSGVVIKGEGYGVTCKGGFRVNGTAANPVIFTSIRDDNQGNPQDTNGDGNGSIPSVNQAPGIFFGPTSDDSYCRLYYLKNYYGGRPYGNSAGYYTYGIVHIESANPEIDRCLFTNLPGESVAIGVYGNSTPIVSNTTFSNGSYLPVSMSLVSNPTFTNITLVSMGYTAILINDQYLNSNATLNPRNFAGINNVAYFMAQCLTINSGSKLTINPGVVIKYQSGNSCINVKGALNIAGTSTNKVVFTHGSDDSAGGDSNNNGNGSTPTNDYFGITFEDESDDAQNNINYFDMRFAGSYRGYREALRFFNSSANVQNTSLNFGDVSLGIFGTSAPTFQNLSISNFAAPVRMQMFANPTFGTITCNNIGYMAIVIDAATYSQNGTFPLRNFAGYNNITYIIDGTQTINGGTTITVPAGMTFKSNYYSAFNVQGKLNVNGTSVSPVVFTVFADDNYGSPADLQNNGNATIPGIGGGGWIEYPDVADDSSTVSYAIFRYRSTPINCNSSSPSIKNCVFDKCNYGVYLNGTSAPVVDNNSFQNLNYTPLITSILCYPASTNNNSMSGSTWKGIYIINETLSQDATLPKRSFGGLNNIPYVFGDFTVGTTATLTINPGVTTKWGGTLYVQKGLNALGGARADSNIVFTSYKDDFYGGDMNSDSTATTADQYYGGIQFQDVSIDPLCKMKNCILANSYYGISMYNASPNIQKCSFINGGYGNGITAYGSSNPTVNYCDFYITPYNTNYYYGVNNANQSFLINAENNWWGRNSGPTHSGNTNGTGTNSTDAVDYLPFQSNGPNTPIIGDVSQNGSVQSYDAALILQSLVNTIQLTSSQQNAADVTGDGTVSALDASQILQYNVGLINFFSAEAYNKTFESNNTILELSHQVGNPGDMVAIPLTLNEINELYGLFGKIKFDTSYLEFDRLEFNDWGMSQAFNSPTKGEILFTMAGANPHTTDGSAGVMYFRIKENAPEGLDIPLNIMKFSANDVDQTTASVSGMISTLRTNLPITQIDDNNITVYPIPARDFVKIKLNTSGFGEQFVYNITDMNGKKIIQSMIPIHSFINQTTELTLDVSRLPSGVYHLNYRKGEKLFSKKLIIIK